MDKQTGIYYFNNNGRHYPIFANHIAHGLNVELHHHPGIEIAYFIKGSATHIYKGQSMFMTAGDLVIIPSESEHCYVQNHSVEIVNCLFLPEVLQSDIEWFQKIEGFFELFIAEPFFRNENNLRDKLIIPEENRNDLVYHFLEITRELKEVSSGYEIAAKTHLYQLLLLLCRIYTTQKKALTTFNGSTGKSSLVTEAIRYIEDHLSERITVDELAAAFFVSTDHFSRLFRQTTGLTPIEYINNMRVSKASKFLLEESSSIAEIASKVGIHDSNYFTKLFKQSSGKTPMEYRTENKTSE